MNDIALIIGAATASVVALSTEARKWYEVIAAKSGKKSKKNKKSKK